MASEYPDLGPVFEVNRSEIEEATRGSSEALRTAGVRHALVGGLAVGAWGYPRWSKDVDYLVGEEAFIVHPGGFVTFAPGVPIAYEGVPVDSISIAPGEGFLSDALDRAIMVDGVPVAPVEALVYLKLKSPRRKDFADVVEILKAGIDAKPVFAWLSEHSPVQAEKFAKAVEQAQEEDTSEER